MFFFLRKFGRQISFFVGFDRLNALSLTLIAHWLQFLSVFPPENITLQIQFPQCESNQGCSQ